MHSNLNSERSSDSTRAHSAEVAGSHSRDITDRVGARLRRVRLSDLGSIAPCPAFDAMSRSDVPARPPTAVAVLYAPAVTRATDTLRTTALPDGSMAPHRHGDRLV